LVPDSSALIREETTMPRGFAGILGSIVLLISHALGSVAAQAGTDADTLPLAQAGQSEYAIVTGQAATEAEAFAVAELRDYFEKATGVRLPLVEESRRASDARGIYVGQTAFASAHGTDVSQLDPEEWVIATVGKDLVLTGGRPVGTLYAVYEFLESRLGCHWLDRDTEIVPRSADLVIAASTVRGKPAFWHRSIYALLGTVEPTAEMLAKEAVFLERNKSTSSLAKFGRVAYGSPGDCHTFYAYSKDFPADHRECFSLNAAGERERATSGSGPGQLCLTNPETRRLLLSQLKSWIAADRRTAAQAGRPAPRVYHLSQNDNASVCQCPACKAMVAAEGSASGPLLDCINELADSIREQYPDVLLMTFAYQMTLQPPKTVRPRDNVIIQLAQLNAEWEPKNPHYPDLFRPMSHPLNRAACEDIAAWSKIARHLAIWDYWILYCNAYQLDRFPTPYVNVAYLQPDLQLFLEHGAGNVFVECEQPTTTSFSALKLWLGQKLLQDPRRPIAPLLQTFLQGYYGSAAPPMGEYLAYLEKRIAAVPGTEPLSSMPAHRRPYLDLEFFTTAHRLLNDAEKACGDDANTLRHVRHEWIPVEAALYCLTPQLERRLPVGEKVPFARDAVLQHFTETAHAELDRFYYGKIPPKAREQVEQAVKSIREFSSGEEEVK
jgi:hypothetical protein